MKRYLKRINEFVLSFFLLLSFVTLALAQEKPLWMQVWEDYLKTHPEDKRSAQWYQRLIKPEALALRNEWVEFYKGYDATVEAMKFAEKNCPEIKPGVVINSKNYKDFPNLQKVLPKALYEKLEEGSYGQIPEIKVVPTTHYYYSKNRLEATKKNMGKPFIDEKGMIQNYDVGIPFPFPKNGTELAWDFDKISVSSDNLKFQPIHFILYDKTGNKERSIMAYIFWRKYQDRVDVPPLGDISGEIFEKGATVFTYPFDVAHFAAVRTRFVDPEKPDYFIAWIPSLRRTRLFSGSDTQDPMLGTDVMWDDWKGSWKKISTKIYPDEYKMEDTFILTPVYRDYRDFKLEGNKLYVTWELQPHWILHVISKDKSYQYSKRMLWVQKHQSIRGTYIENYDQRGNLWRTWVSDCLAWTPENGYFTTSWVDVVDHINKHRTVIYMDSIANDPAVGEDQFNLRILQRMH